MITEILNGKFQPKSDYIFGIADLNGILHKRYEDYKYGISIGKKLDDKVINRIQYGPTLEYYHYYNKINRELTILTADLTKELKKNKIEALPIEPTIALSEKKNERYLPTLTVDLSHKMVATRAGLGWIGKTALFVSKEFGPRLRLVTILLKQKPSHTGKPVENSKCGKCNICVEKCPAQAASSELWNISKHRDQFFNAHKCRDMCNELALRKLKVDKRICGICVAVCPIGKIE